MERTTREALRPGKAPDELPIATTMPAQTVEMADQQWSYLYNGFDRAEGLDATLHQLTALACRLPPWYACAIIAIDVEGDFIERVAETGERTPIFKLLPTRWPLQTSPSRHLSPDDGSMIISDIGACPQYPLYQAEAVAQGYRGVALCHCGTDQAGRALVLSVHSREALVDRPALRDTLARLICVARGEIIRAKACDAEHSRLSRITYYAGLGAELLQSVLAGRSTAEVVAQTAQSSHCRLALLDLPAQRAYFTHADDETLYPSLLTDWQGELATGGSPTAAKAAEAIYIEGRLSGAVVSLDDGISRDEAHYLLLQVKAALSALLLRGHLQAVGMAAGLKTLFETLAAGDWKDTRLFASGARNLGLDPAAPAQLFALEMTEALLADAPQRLARPLAAAWPGALCGQAADLLLVHVSCPDEGLSSPMRQRIWQVISDVLPVQTQALAESKVITGIDAYPGTIRALRHVLRLAQALGRSGRVNIAMFDPFAFLAATLDRGAAPEFIATTLGQIRRYDAEHATRFVDTCMAFGESGCRYQETADRLHIHVSTLRYRLTRITELFDIKLTDPDVRFSLDLAFRLERLLGLGS